jgi:hypothetical protein
MAIVAAPGRLDRIGQWLLSDQVLRPAGSNTAVANWLWPDGRCDALYPEIGGYYLQFLALYGSDFARQAASRVVNWLDEAGPAGDPLTLYFYERAYSDWRNECLFSFDLAMIVRGFDKVEARWPGTVPRSLMTRYCDSVRSHFIDAHLRSHRLRSGAGQFEIPDKWSTRVDVHHVKIAAALAGVQPNFEPLVSATVAEQGLALEREGATRMRELHPFLYLIEGWLMLWGQSGDTDCLARAGMAFDILLRELQADDCVLPPLAGRRDLPTRSDVLSQTLRAGLILQHTAWLTSSSSWPSARATLLEALTSRMTPQGAMEFDAIGHHRNVWASLFSWQALSFSAQISDGCFNALESAAALI